MYGTVKVVKLLVMMTAQGNSKMIKNYLNSKAGTWGWGSRDPFWMYSRVCYNSTTSMYLHILSSFFWIMVWVIVE